LSKTGRQAGGTGNSKKSSDFGPEEKLEHGLYGLETVDPNSFRTRLRRLDDTPFDGLFVQGLITDIQHSAAETFFSDLWAARMLGPSGSNYNRSIGGNAGTASARQLDKLNQVIDALRKVRAAAGRASERLIMSAAIDRLSPTRKTQVALMRSGLDALVLFYESGRGKFVRPPLPVAIRLAG
jgi:hypothetical protein